MSSPKPLTLCIDSFSDDAGYVAWIDNDKFKGIVVQSNSLKRVFEELFISLKVKFAYDYGIAIDGGEEKIESMMKAYFANRETCSDGKQEIKLKFA